MSGTPEESMNVLLSIKPEFAEKILDGDKRYEFRRVGFRDNELIDKVIIYASSPVQRITGVFTVADVIEASPERLWSHFGDESGIEDKDRFIKYFTGKETGYAIEIQDAHRFSTPINPKTHIEEFRPPVSFKYVQDELESLLNHRTEKVVIQI